MEEIIKLPKTAKKIKDSIDHWVDIDGNIYCIDKRKYHKNKIIKKAQQLVHGYKYCAIRYKDKGLISKRIHRIVAETFIPNPNNYNIVGHKNNIKCDNRVSNLYWTTIKENTQKAFDDKLIINAKGYDDNQSIPVNMYDTMSNVLIASYGSISEASKYTGIEKNTISRQAKYKRPVRKPFYFRFSNDTDCTENIQLIGMFEYSSDKLINKFINIEQASKQTGIPDSTISYQCKNGKPKYKTSSNYYFKPINNNKCEETIEILERE